jgi:hypothetical protein
MDMGYHIQTDLRVDLDLNLNLELAELTATLFELYINHTPWTIHHLPSSKTASTISHQRHGNQHQYRNHRAIPTNIPPHHRQTNHLLQHHHQ